MKEATVTEEEIKLESNESLPRPWLANNQVERLARGVKSASIVKLAKMTAAFSHLGPRTTTVSGWASARNKPVNGKLVSAVAS
jgi:hypothetical protein